MCFENYKNIVPDSLGFKTPIDKSAVILLGFPLCVACVFFSLAAFNTLSFFLYIYCFNYGTP